MKHDIALITPLAHERRRSSFHKRSHPRFLSRKCRAMASVTGPEAFGRSTSQRPSRHRRSQAREESCQQPTRKVPSSNRCFSMRATRPRQELPVPPRASREYSATRASPSLIYLASAKYYQDPFPVLLPSLFSLLVWCCVVRSCSIPLKTITFYLSSL